MNQGSSTPAASRYSSPNFVVERHEEAELSLQRGGSLNYEEARALLGRVEYQRGHIEEALRMFDGINISTLIREMKMSISRKAGQKKSRSHSRSQAMPLHAVAMLMETVVLKAMALRDLGKFKGHLKPLARQFEELSPGVLENREWLQNVALCYLAEEDNVTALNLLKRVLKPGDDTNCLKELLLASKICGENGAHTEEGALYARRALANVRGGCNQMEAVANLLLGISLSNQARCATTDTERASKQHEALEMLGKARKKTCGRDFRITYNLSLEYAEQRKLDTAAFYAKKLLKLEAGSELKTWILIARIMSAQKRFDDAECIVNAALDQAGKCCQGDLLQTKAKIQVAKGQYKKAVETYTQLLAVIQLRMKSFSAGISVLQGTKTDRSLEVKTWYHLALLYLRISEWKDAELCISKMTAISPYSPLVFHATGKLHEVKGFLRKALRAYSKALDVEPKHVPSLISTATVLRELCEKPLPAVRCFLTDVLRLDRTNHDAWFNLGLLYKDEGSSSALEAAECFQAAALLEETAPAEPFR